MVENVPELSCLRQGIAATGNSSYSILSCGNVHSLLERTDTWAVADYNFCPGAFTC